MYKHFVKLKLINKTHAAQNQEKKKKYKMNKFINSIMS